MPSNMQWERRTTPLQIAPEGREAPAARVYSRGWRHARTPLMRVPWLSHASSSARSAPGEERMGRDDVPGRVQVSDLCILLPQRVQQAPAIRQGNRQALRRTTMLKLPSSVLLMQDSVVTHRASRCTATVRCCGFDRWTLHVSVRSKARPFCGQLCGYDRFKDTARQGELSRHWHKPGWRRSQ